MHFWQKFFAGWFQIVIIFALLFSIGVGSSSGQQTTKKDRKKTTRKVKRRVQKAAQRSRDLDNSGSRLTGEYIPLQLNGFPQRPRPILEIGENFLGTGTLSQGFKLPTGAVWQPYFMLFGTARSGLQSFDNGNAQVSEWANRFDLFGNLYLTFTERILVGFRPLDQNGRFTSYLFSPNNQPAGLQTGFSDQFNFDLVTLFFEGDFGEIFPVFDKEDKRAFDFGFSVGRQLLSFQEGMLINDNIDAVGITKINWKSLSSVNFRWTLLYGWNQLNRMNLPQSDNTAALVGLFTETDWRKSTVAFDVIYVPAGNLTGDGIYAGLSAVQRLGSTSTSFRILSSYPIGNQTPQNSQGTILFTEISWTPHGNQNLVYLNGFAGFNNFRSASRDPAAGGPLGRAGILFASPGLGRVGSPLSNLADEVVGGALGYQMFFSNTRRQLILEFAGRYSPDTVYQSAFGGGLRYQMALGRRSVIVVDGFGTYDFRSLPMTDRLRIGGRLEYMLQL